MDRCLNTKPGGEGPAHGPLWAGLAAAVWVAALSLPLPAVAQPDPLRIHQTEVKAIEVHRQTQQEQDRWADQKADLQARYRTLLAEEKALEKNRTVLLARVKELQARQSEARRRDTEAARIREELQSHLDTVVARLEQGVTGDLPFLPQERSERIDSVKAVIVQPDTGLAEKCRRVMEAIKVETEYGQTVEVYQQEIRVDRQADAQPLLADILRVGRLALFWRTVDGKTVGQWDRVAGRWTALPNTYRRAINEAAEMALKHRTIDMVKLPLGRIAAP